MKLLEKIKKRWNIESNFQVFVIFIVFGITGSSSLYFKKIIFEYIGLNSDTPNYIYIPAYIFTIIPIYNILLLIWAFIFRQFDFFWNFQKKTFSRFKKRN